MKTKAIGDHAEREALGHLKKHGFQLVKQNYQAKTGEIDLIVTQGDLLVFVEVRLRRHGGYGSGADSVTERKQRKIINTAKMFLQTHQSPTWQSFRFDVVSIGQSIDWIPGAFTLD